MLKKVRKKKSCIHHFIQICKDLMESLLGRDPSSIQVSREAIQPNNKYTIRHKL